MVQPTTLTKIKEETATLSLPRRGHGQVSTERKRREGGEGRLVERNKNARRNDGVI
jgi:hypothetical protein